MPTRYFLILLVASVAFCGGGVAAAQVPTLPPDGGSRLDVASCATFDREKQAVTSFRAGDEFAVRGSRFPANALLLLTLRRGVDSSELGRFRTDGVGNFTTEPTVLRVPPDAPSGTAAILVSSGTGSAECAIQISAAASTAPTSRPEPEPVAEAGNSWFLAWGLLLVLGAGALAYGSYRRWQARRLEEAISSSKSGRPKGSRRRAPGVPPPPRLDPSSLPPPIDPLAPEHGPSSPPVLPPGWDRGMEPTPAAPPSNGKKVVDW